MSAKIFIVYGHDHDARDAVKSIVADLGLTPFVFSEQPTLGAETIIEKFERCARETEFALVILTPDDKDNANETGRARQNVIFEMGWCFAWFGRNRTILLLGGQLEKPTDIDGIIYTRLDKDRELLKQKLDGMLRIGAVLVPRA